MFIIYYLKRLLYNYYVLIICDIINVILIISDSLLPPSYISECAEMNARLDSLMSKWTLYENPLIREQYLAKTKHKWQKTKSKRNVCIISQVNSSNIFIKYYLNIKHPLFYFIQCNSYIANL